MPAERGRGPGRRPTVAIPGTSHRQRRPVNEQYRNLGADATRESLRTRTGSPTGRQRRRYPGGRAGRWLAAHNLPTVDAVLCSTARARQTLAHRHHPLLAGSSTARHRNVEEGGWRQRHHLVVGHEPTTSALAIVWPASAAPNAAVMNASRRSSRRRGSPCYASPGQTIEPGAALVGFHVPRQGARKPSAAYSL